MICYIVRHGKDDESVRGGWSQQPLQEEEIRQAEALAADLAKHQQRFSIKKLYASDLARTMQTAEILGNALHLTATPLPQFREVNNGSLAGMKNDLALVTYPGLFWNQLDWEDCYPDGESPRQFYERIKSAWTAFTEEILDQNQNVMLVTHGGVIHVIRTILENRPYSNQDKHKKVNYGEMIAVSYEKGNWKEGI